MRKYLLLSLFGLVIIFSIGACVLVLKKPVGRALGLSENIEIEAEMAEPRWNREFSYIGDWGEAPDGIEHISVRTHLIKDFQKVENGYFLGYKYNIELQPQEQKKSKKEELEDHLISAYGVDFDFYLLDDDGYCLLELKTSKAQKQTSPNEGYFIYVEKVGEREEEFRGYGQSIIMEVFIPDDVARRTKKIVYSPTFYPNMFTPLDQSNQTAIGSSNT